MPQSEACGGAAPRFISEVSSNHGRDLERALRFVDVSADIGCDAVKFQLFRIDELFAPVVLQKSEKHRQRRNWELPLEFLEPIAERCKTKGLDFSCTPFSLGAVDQLEPFVDFYKIASYELLWDPLIERAAATKKPLILSTGMADLKEVEHAVEVARRSGAAELSLLHCVSGYPTPVEQCNLKAIATLRERFDLSVGWSDHSVSEFVIQRAVHRWNAEWIEFHLDLDGRGDEFAAGHCWLPEDMKGVIESVRRANDADGDGFKQCVDAERDDRLWRADPSDGLRPFLSVRREWELKP